MSEGPMIHESRRQAISNESNTKDSSKRTGDGENMIFVSEVSYDATEDDIYYYFEECGEIATFDLFYRGGMFRGQGKISFKTKEAFEKALEADGQEFMGRPIRVFVAQPSKKDRTQKRGKPGKGETRTLFMSKLSYKATVENVREAFKDCGTITSIRIQKDEFGACNGNAFVSFDCPEPVEKALEKDFMEVCGREIRVDRAHEKVPLKRPRAEGDEGKDSDRKSKVTKKEE